MEYSEQDYSVIALESSAWTFTYSNSLFLLDQKIC